MPYHPFFDAPMYPFGRPDAQALLAALFMAVEQPGAIVLHYRESGGGRPLTPQLPADLAWAEVLRHLTVERRLERFCLRVIADSQLAAVHPAAIAVRDATDILRKIVLPQDIIFLDRKPLRSELEKLSGTGPCGVLLVRGPRGAGKSWTQQFISLVAEHRGAKSVYLYEGTVATVGEVIESLFTTLGDTDAVPPPMETEHAWYKRVCNRLQELAQKRQRILWVVADDLGDDENGPLLDRQIREFFGQFVLNMANPAFSQWFRLVLIDYPDGPVPTKWMSHLWCEDRPDEAAVDAPTIATFLVEYAASKGKQLGEDSASRLAADILAKVDAPPIGADLGRQRLERVRVELQAVLEVL